LNEPLLTVADVGDAKGGEGESVGLEIGDADGDRT